MSRPSTVCTFHPIGVCGAAAIALLIATLACGQQNAWRAQADGRIREIRQRPARIEVLDGRGHPIRDAAVDVQQIRKAFPFGAAISAAILTDSDYREFFRTHFNWAVFENELKWYSNERQPGREDYSRADAMAAWCQQNGIPVRGHCIFWEPERWQPQWVRALEHPDALRAAVERRMESVVGHCRGKVVHWDVNNEMLHGSFFRDRLGGDIHAWMFQRAHQLDPDARLFVNDFNILSVDQSFRQTEADAYVKQIRRLIDQGAPIHGVGIQGHIWSKAILDHPETLRENLDNVAALGLPIWITEFDSAFAEESVNADCLETVYRAAYSHPAVEGILMWVFWAGNSWRGANAGLARRDWQLNAAGERYEKLMAEWTTTASGRTDEDGAFAFRGFHGHYTATIRAAAQEETQVEFALAPGDKPLVVPVSVKPDAPTPSRQTD